MEATWLDVDWSAERPGDAEIEESRRSLTYRPLPVDGEQTLRLLKQLRAVHSNGDVLLAAFQVEGEDSAARWFLTRNRFNEYGFFEHLLTSDPVREALPQLMRDARVAQHAASFEESFARAFAVDGWLAGVLWEGGAYERFTGTASEAKALCARAVEELVGGRYNEFHVYSSYAAWSPWFYDVIWDGTHVLLDRRNRRVHLLALTDTD